MYHVYTVWIVHGCRSPLLEKGFCSIFLKIPGGFIILIKGFQPLFLKKAIWHVTLKRSVWQ